MRPKVAGARAPKPWSVKGGVMRSRLMTAEQRSESARHAALARWGSMSPEERSQSAVERWAKMRRAKSQREKAQEQAA